MDLKGNCSEGELRNGPQKVSQIFLKAYVDQESACKQVVPKHSIFIPTTYHQSPWSQQIIHSNDGDEKAEIIAQIIHVSRFFVSANFL